MQRTRSHTTAVPLCEGPLPLAVVAEALWVLVVREGGMEGEGELTHLATRRACTANLQVDAGAPRVRKRVDDGFAVVLLLRAERERLGKLW